MRESRTAPPNARQPPLTPTSTVIPAQAGIQNPGGVRGCGLAVSAWVVVNGVSPSPNPLPLGEGWRLAPSAGALNYPHPVIPVPHIPSFPHPTVIPAKAGIHTPGLSASRELPGFWIPAYAGMTVGLAPSPDALHHPHPVIPALPSRHFHSLTVIPAKAGIHTPAWRHTGDYRGSGFRPAPE